jgi:2-polyprenyl-3-methyl-5-hydroxy-6-metoxy-1,4-benzoquinol methylase
LADINKDWLFIKRKYDLITFSLVLEHFENLDEVFKKASMAIKPNGFMYLGELHPFKQYSGTKARFETAEGRQIVTCFNHHVSEFANAAKKNGFEIVLPKEYFDGRKQQGVPRILTLLFQKK